MSKISSRVDNRDTVIATTSDLPEKVQPPPDGGLAAWTQALLGNLTAFSTWGALSSWGLFQSYYESNLLSQHSSSEIAWIGSVQLFLIMGVGTFSGRAFDAGYFRLIYIAGSFLLVLGFFMTSLCSEYWQFFLAQALCTGFGCGLMFIPALSLVATYFSSYKVLALAFVLTGGGIGGMVFPAMVSQLLPRLGFPWTIRVLGFLVLGLCLITSAFYRTRLPPRTSGPLIEWAAFREPTYVLYIAGMWFILWPLYFAFYYIGPFGSDIIGLDYQQSLSLIIVINGVGIVGRLIPAFVAGKYFGPVNTIIPCAIFSAVLLYCWAAIFSVSGTYVFAVIYGFFASGVQGLWPGGLTSLTTDITKTGTRVGMGFSIVSIAILTGPPVGGALISVNNGNYLYAQMWSASSFIVGTLILVGARFSNTGPRLFAKV